MRYIETAQNSKRSVGLYAGGIFLLVLLYILGSLPLFLDWQQRFPGTTLSLDDVDMVLQFGKLRLFFWMLFPFVLLFFGLLIYLVLVHKRRLLQIFTAASHFRWSRFFWFACLLLVLLFVVSIVPFVISNQLNTTLRWNFNVQKFFPLLTLSLLLIPIQAAAEELIFRVYALQGLYARTGKIWLSILLSAVLFAAVHGSNPEVQALGPAIIGYYLMAGVFLALISVQDDGLELALAYHSINNLFSAVVISSTWQVFHTDALWLDTSAPGTAWGHLLIGVLFFTGLYFILAKKYRWKPLVELH
ncbi:MAG: lysostaphin resistance A-like protein [Flavobacteriales bacterium]